MIFENSFIFQLLIQKWMHFNVNCIEITFVKIIPNLKNLNIYLNKILPLTAIYKSFGCHLYYIYNN